MQRLEETELRKADRTVGVNSYIFSNIWSGTALLLQGNIIIIKIYNSSSQPYGHNYYHYYHYYCYRYCYYFIVIIFIIISLMKLKLRRSSRQVKARILIVPLKVHKHTNRNTVNRIFVQKVFWYLTEVRWRVSPTTNQRRYLLKPVTPVTTVSRGANSKNIA